MKLWQICLALLLTVAVRAEWRVETLAELPDIPLVAGFTEQSAQVVFAEEYYPNNPDRDGNVDAQGKVSMITCSDGSELRVLTIPGGNWGSLSPTGDHLLLLDDEHWLYTTATGNFRRFSYFMSYGPYDWGDDGKYLAIGEGTEPGSIGKRFRLIELATGREIEVHTDDGFAFIRMLDANTVVANNTIWQRNAEGEWQHRHEPLLDGYVFPRTPTGRGARFVIPLGHTSETKGMAFVNLSTRSRRLVPELDGSRWFGAFEADDGATVALVFNTSRKDVHSYRIAIWDVEALREQTSFEVSLLTRPYSQPTPAFSPDGSLIAFRGQDKLWNTADGSVAVQLPGRAVISGATSFGHGNRLVVHNEGEKAKLIKIKKVEEP